MYMTYEKASSFAGYVIVNERLAKENTEHVQRLVRPSHVSTAGNLYLAPRTANRIGETLGQLRSCNNPLRRDTRLSVLWFWVVIAAYCLVGYFTEEEQAGILKEDDRTSLIKYIHDIDGKKRMLCLT